MILLIIIAIVIAFFIIYRTSKKQKEKKVYEQFSCVEGDFIIKGRKDNFLVKKNGNLEFLVKDGQIVASRDLRIGKDFVYYGGTADGISK